MSKKTLDNRRKRPWLTSDEEQRTYMDAVATQYHRRSGDPGAKILVIATSIVEAAESLIETSKAPPQDFVEWVRAAATYIRKEAKRIPKALRKVEAKGRFRG